LHNKVVIGRLHGSSTDTHHVRWLALVDMAPYYVTLCNQFKWPIDNELLGRMTQANEDALQQLNDKLKSAEETEGESEVRDALLATAELYTRIGDKVCTSQPLSPPSIATLPKQNCARMCVCERVCVRF
jgi:hypothetical protein